MNKFSGNIIDIEISGSLSLVTVELSGEVSVKVIVVETPESADYLEKGKAIDVLFKETEVVVGINQDPGVSIQNRISGTVKSVEKGSLISHIVVNSVIGEISAVISTESLQKLGLNENMAVLVFIKSNEIMLSE